MPNPKKTSFTPISSAEQRGSHADAENAPIALYSRNSDKSDLAFPAVDDAYTGASAIGVSGVYVGRRLILGERVVTGSWRRKDGTRSYKFSRWVTFEREMAFDYEADGKTRTFRQLMNGRALIPESSYTCVAIVKAKVAA